MQMSKQILDQQISDMHKRFESLDALDFEGKVDNIKHRIFLLKQAINYNDKPKEEVKEDEAVVKKRAEMDSLRQSMVPKKKPVKSLPFDQADMEMQKADEELKRALNKAFESI